MVALGIFAVLSGMFIETQLSSVMAQKQLAARREAIHVARSRLALAMETASGSSAGQTGEFRWTTTVSPYTGTESGPGLERLTVAVSEPGVAAPLAVLSTLRIAR